MQVIIFELWPKEGRRADYMAVAADLRGLLETIPGFVSVERFESLSTAASTKWEKGLNTEHIGTSSQPVGDNFTGIDLDPNKGETMSSKQAQALGSAKSTLENSVRRDAELSGETADGGEDTGGGLGDHVRRCAGAREGCQGKEEACQVQGVGAHLPEG